MGFLCLSSRTEVLSLPLISIALYEAFYGRRCRSPADWFEVGEVTLIGPDSVHYAKGKVQFIRDRLKTAKSHQKSYANIRRKEVEFQVEGGDEIRQERDVQSQICKVAYELEFPEDLEVVHPVFHISLLKKCVGDPASVVPLESVVVKYRLCYEDVPVEILDSQVRRLRNKEVASVKVWWRSQSIEGAIWEVEAAMKAKYPHLFPSIPLQLERIVPFQFFNH
ncbi:hypothetical protein MTR67_043401 [Solanum verrucosum]|uniref:Tf2-1-like SH3-like domain-containing protein n=1 Tax=Solanum verrucosum TaxID=315347 RepID=A0AAF0URB0_SOLVR|nr:hypothetical protein MTR67_043401 [Solanum verrucosum]